MSRDIAGAYLRANGHTTICVEDGEGGRGGRKHRFRCRPDGRVHACIGRLIRALDGARGRVPIVALTAQAFTEQIAECRKAGMDSHLVKPFNLDRLLDIVARHRLAR